MAHKHLQSAKDAYHGVELAEQSPRKSDCQCWTQAHESQKWTIEGKFERDRLIGHFRAGPVRAPLFSLLTVSALLPVLLIFRPPFQYSIKNKTHEYIMRY
jgi:hypothetical protein